jgi:hypothetical protein
MERVLGRDHPNTLAVRLEIASWAAAAGDIRGALVLLSALQPDQERVLGANHAITLRTHHVIKLLSSHLHESLDP